MAGKTKHIIENQPVKTPAEKRRKTKVQRKRLAGLGVPEAVVAKLNDKQVRLMLKCPGKIRKPA